MNDFMKEFKKMNPNVSDSRAKEIFNEQKRREKKEREERVEIIKVPSIEKETTPVIEIIPEKTNEEIQREQEEEAERLRIKEENIAKKLYRKNLGIILELWGNNLSRALHDQSGTTAFPQFPLHPITRAIVSPVDIFTVFRDVAKNNEESEDDIIVLPFLLVVLASDKTQLLKIYDEFNRIPLRAPISLRNFFLSKGLKFSGTWTPMILPPLRQEYIQVMRNELQYNFPKTIKLDEMDMDNVKKAPLEDVLSLHELLEKISSNPVILSKISDHELEFFNLNTAQIMELRTLFAEKSKAKRNALLKIFVKKLTPDNDTSVQSGKQNKTKQCGGKDKNNDNTAILATFI